jgi:hypothetical protein
MPGKFPSPSRKPTRYAVKEIHKWNTSRAHAANIPTFCNPGINPPANIFLNPTHS